MIGYFYEPQWFFSEVPLAHVKLPQHTAGCDAEPAKVACDYPVFDLDKMTPEAAAKKWIEANPDKVEAWLG
ncbi:hypothetical protein GCM10023083_08750 [Streptomyces phyllanthi]